MTPTEKAVQLYRYYIDYTQGHYNCKQCCLIAVNEILNQYSFGKFDFKILDEAEFNYWQEVKQEIDKL